MRNDVHSPKNMKPEDYEFVACGNYGTADMDAYSPLRAGHAHLLDEGWRFGGESGRNCDHCGAFIIYYALLKHLPSHTLIKVGETCLDNRFELANDEFQRLRKAGKLNRERRKLSEKRAEFLSRPGVQALYDWAKEQPGFRMRDGFDDESFESKFVRYIERHGEASEKFVAAMFKAQARAAEYAERKAKEAAEAKPVEVGKQVIIGEIKSLKWKESPYGPALKMLVLDDRGFKVWGTVPRAVVDELDTRAADDQGSYRGLLPLRVRVRATVTVSRDDPTFGFFSRPQGGQIIES